MPLCSAKNLRILYRTRIKRIKRNNNNEHESLESNESLVRFVRFVFKKKKTIMKKTYMQPDIQVVKVEQHLLNNPASEPKAGFAKGSVDAGSVGARSGGWDDED